MGRKIFTAAIAICAMACFTGPAQANESAPEGVAAGYLALYQHDDQTGCHYNAKSDDYDLSNNRFGYFGCEKSVDNTASSMRNTSSRDVRLWQHAGRSGISYLAKANTQDDDFTNNNFDNKTSAVEYW